MNAQTQRTPGLAVRQAVLAYLVKAFSADFRNGRGERIGWSTGTLRDNLRYSDKTLRTLRTDQVLRALKLLQAEELVECLGPTDTYSPSWRDRDAASGKELNWRAIATAAQP